MLLFPGFQLIFILFSFLYEQFSRFCVYDLFTI